MERSLPVTNIFFEVGLLKGYYFSMEGTGIPFVLKMVYKGGKGRPDLGSEPSRMVERFPSFFFHSYEGYPALTDGLYLLRILFCFVAPVVTEFGFVFPTFFL